MRFSYYFAARCIFHARYKHLPYDAQMELLTICGLCVPRSGSKQLAAWCWKCQITKNVERCSERRFRIGASSESQGREMEGRCSEPTTGLLKLLLIAKSSVNCKEICWGGS